MIRFLSMFLTLPVAVILIVLSVAIHYEVLRGLANWVPKLRLRHRGAIIIGVFGALLAHSIEVWVFAIGYYLITRMEVFGSFAGVHPVAFDDCVYFSFATYTTLGYGDITPQGAIRFLAGMEAITGLVLIAWTASFLYLQMERNWTKAS